MAHQSITIVSLEGGIHTQECANAPKDSFGPPSLAGPPGRWRTHYTHWMEAGLYDTRGPARASFLYRAYAQGQRHDQPVFAHHAIAWAGAELVGIVTVSVRPQGHPYANLYVKPAWRRQGVGSQLLAQAQVKYPTLAGYPTPSARDLYVRHRLWVGSLEEAQALLSAMGEGNSPAGKP